MDVDDDDPDFLPQALHLRADPAEGILYGCGHEDAPLGVHDPDAGPIACGGRGRPAARGAGREVQRAQEPGLGVQQLIGVALLPGVVASGDDVHPGGEDLLDHPGVDPRPARGVLPVGDDELRAEAAAQPGQALTEDPPPRLAVHVPHEKEAHYLAYSMTRVSRSTVTLICPGYSISSSIFLATSRARFCAAVSSMSVGRTMTRTSRPAWIA